MRDRLTVVTYNMWHGLNPTGLIMFEEQETTADRDRRMRGFYHHVRALNPDIIFLQEVNPAPGLSRRLAADLGYDHTFIVDNAGVKIGAFGPPFNFRSGQAILAKPDLHLQALGGTKLSGKFGWAAWHSSLQFSEFRDAVAAAVTVNQRRVLLMGLHAHHGPEADREIQEGLDELEAAGVIDSARRQEILSKFAQASVRRRGELEKALAFASRIGMDRGPVLFAGDFNASPDSPELMWLKNEQQFASVTADEDPASLLITWDHRRNLNTHYFHDFVPVHIFEPDVMRVLNPLVVTGSKRIDYVFHRGFGESYRVVEAGLFGEELFEGHYASDHFGVYAVFHIED
ncbi:MAG: endonuclease/exonuclease/phosphatase family protein [Candidatus Lernaella stagnicola]|nr:endonuclease/exonuclease/phosphatase family protein [Candidatus Lernaella stagnicola]